MRPPKPAELWFVDLDKPGGSESGLVRPALVVGSPYMRGPLVMVAPLTTTPRDYPWRVELDPSPESGLDVASFVQVEHLRSLSTHRLIHRIGTVGVAEFARVRDVLRLLLDF